MSVPHVSILIPCRNAAPWLRTALESALAQQDVTLEVVVVDDASTDTSREIVRSYAGRGVKLFVQPPRGAAAARNHALLQSQAPWVQFLDADDALAPDKLARQFQALRHAGPDTVASASWGRFAADQTPDRATFADQAVERDFVPGWKFLLHQAETGDMMHPAAWLCPRALLERAGPWNEQLSLNDDGEYFARVLRLATAVKFAPGARSYYRSAVPGSLSRTRSRSALLSLHRSVETMAERLLSAEDSPQVRQALANLWERTRFDLYPEAPDLSADAGRRARSWGRPHVAFPCGPRLRWLARIAGWKAASRLQHRFSPR